MDRTVVVVVVVVVVVSLFALHWWMMKGFLCPRSFSFVCWSMMVSRLMLMLKKDDLDPVLVLVVAPVFPESQSIQVQGPCQVCVALSLWQTFWLAQG